VREQRAFEAAPGHHTIRGRGADRRARASWTLCARRPRRRATAGRRAAPSDSQRAGDRNSGNDGGNGARGKRWSSPSSQPGRDDQPMVAHHAGEGRRGAAPDDDEQCLTPELFYRATFSKSARDRRSGRQWRAQHRKAVSHRHVDGPARTSSAGGTRGLWLAHRADATSPSTYAGTRWDPNAVTLRRSIQITP
jgi:hypothetical protein